MSRITLKQANTIIETAFAKARAQLTADLQQKFEKAASYAEMYQLIGEELWVANRLLDSVNPEYVRAGMALALSASKHALKQAENGLSVHVLPIFTTTFLFL